MARTTTGEGPSGSSPTQRELEKLGRDGSDEAIAEARGAVEGYRRDEKAAEEAIVAAKEERKRVRLEIRRAERELDRQERAAVYRRFLLDQAKAEEGDAA